MMGLAQHVSNIITLVFFFPIIESHYSQYYGVIDNLHGNVLDASH